MGWGGNDKCLWCISQNDSNFYDKISDKISNIALHSFSNLKQSKWAIEKINYTKTYRLNGAEHKKTKGQNDPNRPWRCKVMNNW